MQVFFSTNTPKAKRVYHKSGCIYEKRIQVANKMSGSKEIAEQNGYRECKCCAGLGDEVKVSTPEIAGWTCKEDVEVIYEERTDTSYVITEIGAWKIFRNRHGKYVLFHMNKYLKGMSFYEIKRAAYHCQSDVKATDLFGRIMNYIIDHDRAKLIIMDDYRKLPRKTKKQKKYYRQAERRHKRKQRFRIDAVFASLERRNPELKQYSIC